MIALPRTLRSYMVALDGEGAGPVRDAAPRGDALALAGCIVEIFTPI